MRCALHSLAGILLSLCAATQAQAISEERVQNLYDFLDIALRCEVASGVLKVSLASQRNQLQEMLTSTGMELGEAMLAGQVSNPDPGYGRRCLVLVNLAPEPRLSATERTFLIGYEFGKARSCFNELFWDEVNRSVPTGPLIGGDSAQEVQDRMRVQQFALERFRELGCESLRTPD